MIRDSKGKWPYPSSNDIKPGDEAAYKAYRTERDSMQHVWTEIDQDVADRLQGAVPPIYFKGGFFMGEPANIDARGVNIYSAVVRINGRYFLRDVAVDRIKEAIDGLHAILAADVLVE
jgi:hypothetical protein